MSASVDRDAGAERYNEAAPRRGHHPMIFISYSHVDAKWCEEVLTMAAPLTKYGAMQAFSDSDIAAGAQWPATIRKNLEKATFWRRSSRRSKRVSGFPRSQKPDRSTDHHATMERGLQRAVPSKHAIADYCSKVTTDEETGQDEATLLRDTA